MEYHRLGSAGVRVSQLSIGTWTYGDQLDAEVSRQCLRTAYELGMNFFDSSEAYGYGKSETVMGEALREYPRESLVISSKVFYGGTGPNDIGLSRKHIMEACNRSLRRTGFEYLDLYFCHRPDPNTTIEETVRAMDDLIHQGKILYWGTSWWSADQIMQAYSVARQYGLYPPQMEQPQYNLFVRQQVEEEYARLYREIGLGTTVWSPLASGLLTGKYNDGIPQGTRAMLPGFEWVQETIISPERVEKVRQLVPIAEELGCSLAQLALAWCLKNPNVSTVITGASRPEQVRENVKALEVVPKLTPDVMERIERLTGEG